MQNPRQYRFFSDDELVERSKNGDNRAFSELIRRHHNSCTSVAHAILHHPHDAEDETQNAFLKAYRHIRQFQSDSKFSTWLTRIVVNQCLMRLRQSRRAKVVYLDEPTREDARAIEPRSTSATPEDAVAREQMADVLRHEIRRIPPLLRDVFVLRDVQELPMSDVAKRLGISTAAAKSRLLRARLELRNRMSKHQSRTGPTALIA